jgi:hypothetical protein
MSVSKILDFTKIIDEPKNSYNFNPSIAHWKNNLYLVCYRSFIRYKNIKDQSYTYDPSFDPNHPWLGGRGSNTYWQTVDGYDATGFFIMKIEQSITMMKKMNDGKSIIIKDDEGLKMTTFRHLPGVDARLIFLREDHFAMIYNVVKKDENYRVKGENCGKGCMLIAIRILKIENGNLIAYKEQILCPEISNTTEKNWSLWLYKQNFYFSYGLSPKHKIYELYYDKNGSISCMPNFLEDQYEIYGQIEEIYNRKEKILAISTSTPAIQRKNGFGKYIGVGHIKYFNNLIVNLINPTPLENFHVKTSNFQKHPFFNYLMFIYEFDPENGNISSISDFFIPEESNFILSFPTGLFYIDNELSILYGDHDSSCKMIIFNENILTKLLKPFVISQFDPKNINFFFFPQRCVLKNDLCKILLEI